MKIDGTDRVAVSTSELRMRIDVERFQVQDTRQRLIREMKDLADPLIRETELCTSDPSRMINSLGVVQSRGLEIDRQCAVLRCKQDALKVLEGIGENATAIF